MSGSRVVLRDDTSGRIAAYVRALALLPPEPAWVLVGGLAVNIRLQRVHRATYDIDTITRDQARLVEVLVGGNADRLSAAKVQLHRYGVEVDVMESTEGAELSANPSDRAFALARRWTMATASVVDLFAIDGTATVADTSLQVAAVPALVALKTVSIPRRSSGSYPQKIGSDMQDLYRLVEGASFDKVVTGFDSAPDELRLWVAAELKRTFTSTNLRYSAARLRLFANNADGRSVIDCSHD
ncbi:MAG: hypothetical protein ACYC1D_15940 [Acidimicrobiales bacterium]